MIKKLFICTLIVGLFMPSMLHTDVSAAVDNKEVVSGASKNIDPIEMKEIEVMYADTFTLSDWMYTENASEIILSGYVGSETDLYIPGEFKNKQVKVTSFGVFNSIGLSTIRVQEVNKKKVQSISSNANYSFAISPVESLDLSGMDMSNITIAYQMFFNSNNIKNLNISNWDTSNITDMNMMFKLCTSLETLDISKWNISNVTSINDMFAECIKLKSLDISKWNTSNVVSMFQTFARCSSLETLDVSKWNTKNVTNMQSMFEGCSKLKELNINNWNTANVWLTNSMFEGCSSLRTLNLNNWNVSNVIDMNRMFRNTEKLTIIDISNWSLHPAVNTTFMFETMAPTPLAVLYKGSDAIMIGYSFTGDSRTKLKVDVVLNAGLGKFSDNSKTKTQVMEVKDYLTANENDVKMSASTYNAIFESNKPTYLGHTYTWNPVKLNFTGSKYISELGNTHTATWTKNVYSINYNLNGGTNHKSNPKTYTFATGVASLYNPTKQGYIFDGWYKESTFKNKVTNITTTQVGNVSLYAKWKEDPTFKKLTIIDDSGSVDGVVMIYRTGNTKETSLQNPNGYKNDYALALRLNGKALTATELKELQWKIEATGGCSNKLTYLTVNNGTNKVVAKKSGIVNVTLTYKGSSASIQVVIPGDVSRDGILNTADALRIQKYASNRNPKPSDLGTADKFTLLLADMNGDGKVNTADKVVIQKMVSKTIKPSN